MVVAHRDPSPIARRLSASIRASAERQRMPLLEMARAYPDVINLGRGDPDLPTPAHIVEAAKRALEEGYTHYTPLNGLPELRQAIAETQARKSGLKVDPDSEVMVTTGGQEAVFIIAQALLDPGDEMLMPDPHYSSYDLAAAAAGGRLVPVPAFPEDGFLVRPEEVERRITSRTKALIIVSPDNPSAALYPPELLSRLADVARRHELVVVSDEIYSRLVFGNRRAVSLATLPGMRERTIIVDSFSKAYAMTGWRVGYVVAPADFVAAIGSLRHTLTICAPTFAQKAAAAALTGPQDCVAELVHTYDERQRHFVQGLRAMGLDAIEPQGTFYVFFDVRSLGIPSSEVCERLLREARVLAFPGNSYGEAGDGFVRASLAVPLDRIKEAIDRMARSDVIRRR